MNEISALIRRGQRASSLFFCHVRIQGEVGSLQLRRGLSPEHGHVGTLISDSGLQNCEKEIYVTYKPPCLWCFVIAAQAD